jgi:prepilin-type N-terminal cleavage/methylation domain-containing protein
MTMIEMMIVMVIIAVVMTGAALGMGSLTRQHLKSSSMRVAGAVRTAYSRAATTGKTVRIVFDIDNRAFWGEEAEGGRVLLSRDDDEAGYGRDDEAAEAEEEGGAPAAGDAPAGSNPADVLSGMLGLDPSQLMSVARGAAEADLEGSADLDMLQQLSAAGEKVASQMGKTPRYHAPRFSPLEGRLGKRTTLEDGVGFASIVTEHREEPALEGTAALYFFPGGLTELAVIQVRDDDGFVNSVEVRPLTGRCIIHDVPFELPYGEDERVNEAREAL